VFITANPRMLGDGIAGAVGVLPKPFDPDSIRQTVEYLLNINANDAQMTPPPGLTVFNSLEHRA
jgi:two-component system, response regulator PdtaR